MPVFKEIYKTNYTMIYRFSFRFLGEHCLAEDVTQDTFMKLFTNLEANNEILNPKSWLFKVASNLCKNHLKQKDNDKKLMSNKIQLNQFSDNNPENALIRTDEILRLRQALKKLSFQDQLLLQLYQENFSYKEISEITNIKVTSVGKKISRAIVKCKNQLNKAGL
jgi:RNA polymerase sigma-70 factor (ECF subfamily)